MKITPTTTEISRATAEAVVVGIFEDLAPAGWTEAVDRTTGGLIGRLIESKDVTGKANEVTPLREPQGMGTPLVLVVGLGPKDTFDRQAARQAAGSAAKWLAGRERTQTAYYLATGWNDRQIESAVVGAAIGSEGQDLYRTEKALHPPDEMLWAGAAENVIASARIIAEAVNLTRHLVNQPAAELYPESFAAEAHHVAEELGIEAVIWKPRQLQAQRCGALLAVGRGSSRPPRLATLRYAGGPKDAAPLALVGKGVTFDSGGLSLKPSDGMKDMKCDMAGAATVLGTVLAIARLELPINVVGLLGLVENVPGADSYKLGDVLTSRSGKTIEVHNTDAEGRLVLADVLSVALDEKPSQIVDVATLTGACVVALGLDVAGAMTNDQAWCDAVLDAARECGEPLWQLPMFDLFDEQIKGKVADVKNVGEGRWGGAITAAKFLQQFVGRTPWTHLDVAGPAFLEKPKSWLDAGGSGVMVQTLVELARRLAAK